MLDLCVQDTPGRNAAIVPWSNQEGGHPMVEGGRSVEVLEEDLLANKTA